MTTKDMIIIEEPKMKNISYTKEGIKYLNTAFDLVAWVEEIMNDNKMIFAECGTTLLTYEDIAKACYVLDNIIDLTKIYDSEYM